MVKAKLSKTVKPSKGKKQASVKETIKQKPSNSIKEYNSDTDDESSDEDYEEEEDQEDEVLDLQTDAMLLIEKISGETGMELSKEEETRLKKALEKLDEEDKAAASDDEAEKENTEASNEDEEDGEEEEPEEEEDVPLSDVELDDDADLVPFQKITVYNRAAIVQVFENVALPYDNWKFSEHLSVTASKPLIFRDVFDDMEREEKFSEQALNAAKEAYAKIAKEENPFCLPIPSDYTGPMIRDSDGTEETAEYKQQVSQTGAPQERKTKRKRKAETLLNEDDFDIAVEESNAAIAERRGGGDFKKPFGQRSNFNNGGADKKRFVGNGKPNTGSRSSAPGNGKRMKSGGDEKGPNKGAAPKSRRPGKSKRVGRK